MTREEAIDVLKDILEEATSDEDAVCYVTSEDVKAFNMAIEALSADGDLISRADVKAEATKFFGHWVVFENRIDNLPSVPLAETPTDQQKHQLSEETPTNEPTDIISRADAIDAVCNDWCYVTYENCPHIGDGYRTDGCDSVEAIKQLQSADIPTKLIAKINIDADEVVRKIKDEYDTADRPSGEWKLASEELPQKVGSYIVTCKDEYGWCYVDYDYWTVSDEFKYNRSKVTAWIPFPKPYCGAKMGSDTR